MRRLFFILLVTLYFGLAARAADPVPLTGVAAIVNNSIITIQDVQKLTMEAVRALPLPPAISRETYDQKVLEAYKESLQSLIAKQLILDEFANSGGKMPPSLLEDQVRDRIRKRYGERARMIKSLQAQGLTYEHFRQQEHDAIVMDYMRFKNVSQNVLISPQKIDNFYHTNLANFQLGEQVKLRALVLNSPVKGMAEEVKRLAIEIARKMDDGAEFTEMAAVYSEGSQRTEGGDWGWRGTNYLRKGLSDLAFSQPVGKRSNVMGLAYEQDQSYWMLQYDDRGDLQSGRKYSSKEAFLEEKKFTPSDPQPPAPQEFYLLLVEDKRAAHTKPLEEVRYEIEKVLIAQERARYYNKWLERLKEKAFIRMF